MKSALSISKESWDKFTLSCPPELLSRLKTTCERSGVAPSQILLSLINMVVSGDVKLEPHPKMNTESPRAYMQIAESEGDFDVARVKMYTLDGKLINTTPLSNRLI